MQVCRYDDDRLGVVRGANVHDVSALQAEIRARAPYTYKGDVIAAFLHAPDNRRAMAEAAAKSSPVPLGSVKLLAPVARPTKLVCAPTNYQKHIAEMAAAREARGSKHTARIGEDGLFLKANSALVGPSEGHRDQVSGTAQRSRSRARRRHRQARLGHSARQRARPRHRLQPGARHDRARRRGSQLPQVA